MLGMTFLDHSACEPILPELIFTSDMNQNPKKSEPHRSPLQHRQFVERDLSLAQFLLEYLLSQQPTPF
jgi:hypothetical protein